MPILIATLYFISLLGLIFFGVHRLKISLGYLRWKRKGDVLPRRSDGLRGASLCIQCPIYNEPAMAIGLLEAVTAVEWDEGCLEIQVLDDSTDETSSIVEGWLRAHPEQALNCHHIRRQNRTGYKAGALAEGTKGSKANFFAIFDVDFRPSKDFLRKMMPLFVDDDIGMVQARWGFENRKSSFLTRVQSILLDAHFVVEQTARFADGLFFNFNGTAGIWRRQALEDAGGWTSDTVTEDLDLSYRAQMRGWRFVYDPDVVALSELPESLVAFKSQQRRWTKGGIQVMRKLLPRILRSNLPGKIKREASFHLTVGFVHFFLVLFSITLVPYLSYFGVVPQGAFAVTHPLVILLAGASTVTFYVMGQFFRSGRWHDIVLWLLAAPLVLSFGLAMSLTCFGAAIEGLFSSGGEFVRTPKGKSKNNLRGLLKVGSTRPLLVMLAIFESILGFVLMGAAYHYASIGLYAVALMLTIKGLGFWALVLYFLSDAGAMMFFGSSVRPRKLA
jgi:cellulose synthase/poly-beta-1,6-N-acetylglucosamine synthase-like glycosyltransferase